MSREQSEDQIKAAAFQLAALIGRAKAAKLVARELTDGDWR